MTEIVTLFMPASSPAKIVQRFHLKLFALRPSHVHAQEHLRPILRFGSSRSGMDGDNRIVLVELSGEEQFDVQRSRAGFEYIEFVGQLLLQAGILLS